jgi:hypothetical protein
MLHGLVVCCVLQTARATHRASLRRRTKPCAIVPVPVRVPLHAAYHVLAWCVVRATHDRPQRLAAAEAAVFAEAAADSIAAERCSKRMRYEHVRAAPCVLAAETALTGAATRC